MTSIHEFRSHGPNGRAGWTFVKDEEWSVTDGFKSDDDNAPSWRLNPDMVALFQAIREHLTSRPGPRKFQIFDRIKELKISLGTDPADQREFVNRFMVIVPCFQCIGRTRLAPTDGTTCQSWTTTSRSTTTISTGTRRLKRKCPGLAGAAFQRGWLCYFGALYMCARRACCKIVKAKIHQIAIFQSLPSSLRRLRRVRTQRQPSYQNALQDHRALISERQRFSGQS